MDDYDLVDSPTPVEIPGVDSAHQTIEINDLDNPHHQNQPW